jgi:hypothetical protein
MVWGLYSVAAALALVWVVLSVWALLGDRSTGRRRCPKCFFSLEGLASRRCPECGREARSERDLHRTRRRWGLAAVGALLLLGPACATAWLARVQQVGAWGDVPTGVITRLLWTGDAEIVDETIARIRSYDVGWPDADRVARVAAANLGVEARRERGYLLLEALARNSFSNAFNDRKPMLEELSPDRTAAALLGRFEAGAAGERVRVIGLLSHLRDADERANLLILSHLADPDGQTAQAARQALGNSWRPSGSVERLPPFPIAMPDLDARSGRSDPWATEDVAWLAARIGDIGDDMPAATDLARRLATGELRSQHPESDGWVFRSVGIWLWCRLDREDPRCFGTVEEFAGAEHPRLRATAVRQLTAFPWSGKTEAILRRALADPDPRSEIQFAATQVIERFGMHAKPLVPDMLDYARRPIRSTGSNFPAVFAAAGGEPEALLSAILERLELIREQAVGEAPHEERVHPRFDFTWIADLGIQDAAAAETVRWFMESRFDRRYRPYSDVANAPVAHAVLSGDGEYATRFLLERDLSFGRHTFIGSWEHALLTLCARGLAEVDLVIDGLAARGDRLRREGFLQIVRGCPTDGLEPFRPGLELLTSDEDAAIADAAAGQLRRLD